jgi:hypothetical protein
MSYTQDQLHFEVKSLDGETHSISVDVGCSLNGLSCAIRSVSGKYSFRLYTDAGDDLFKRFDPDHCVGFMGLENGSSLTMVDEGLDDVQVRFLMLMKASTSVKRTNLEDSENMHEMLSGIARSASKGEHLNKPALIRAVQQTYHHGLYSSENSPDEWLDKYFDNGRQIGRFAHCRKLPHMKERAEEREVRHSLSLWLNPRPLSYYGPSIGYATPAAAAAASAFHIPPRETWRWLVDGSRSHSSYNKIKE